MRCIRKGCQNKAEVSQTYGVLPCRSCQQNESKIKPKRKFEFANLSKAHRVQAQRDRHLGDLEQPFMGNKANEKFFKIYPEQVKTYGVRKELEKL